MKHFSLFLFPLGFLGSLCPSDSRAALLLHASFDNTTVTGGGAATTASGAFAVATETGPDGNVRANSHTGAGTSISGAGYHATSGVVGKLGQAIQISNPAAPASGTPTNPTNGNSGINVGGVAAPGVGDYSVSMWVNFQGLTQGTLTSSTTGGAFLFGSGSNTTSSGREGLSIFYDKAGGNMVFRFGSGDSADANTESGGGVASPDHRAGVSIPYSIDANWHLITLVLDSNGPSVTVSGYVDGSASGAVAGGGGAPDATALLDSDGLNNSADLLTFGTRGITAGAATPNNYGTTWVLRGALDDVAIWNQALRADEIASLYDQGLNGINAGNAVLIPEPGTTGMAAAAGMLLLRRRRK